MEVSVSSIFHLFAASGKRKQQASICFLETENGSLFFLGRQTINGNQRLLCQQTCQQTCQCMEFCSPGFEFSLPGIEFQSPGFKFGRPGLESSSFRFNPAKKQLQSFLQNILHKAEKRSSLGSHHEMMIKVIIRCTVLYTYTVYCSIKARSKRTKNTNMHISHLKKYCRNHDSAKACSSTLVNILHL